MLSGMSATGRVALIGRGMRRWRNNPYRTAAVGSAVLHEEEICMSNVLLCRLHFKRLPFPAAPPAGIVAGLAPAEGLVAGNVPE